MRSLSADEILALTKQGEGQNLEYKTTFRPGDERILLAFANADGGVLLIGVADNGEIVGVPRNETDRIVKYLRQVTESLFATPSDVLPIVRIDTVEVHAKAVIYVLVGAVPPFLKPLTDSKGKLYIRHGAGKTEAIVLARQAAEDSKSITSRRRLKVFVAMSFRSEHEPALEDYFRAIERAASDTGLSLKIVRIDQVEGDFEISQAIMDSIDACDIVITDFTLAPRNVYFELGYARGREKRIIQTARTGTPLEFDIRNWKTIFYRNATELEAKIAGALESAYRELTEGTP